VRGVFLGAVLFAWLAAPLTLLLYVVLLASVCVRRHPRGPITAGVTGASMDRLSWPSLFGQLIQKRTIPGELR
jgi:hypothetical protein